MKMIFSIFLPLVHSLTLIMGLGFLFGEDKEDNALEQE
jgi:hypothetical protein